MTIATRFAWTVLDCPDARSLAEFYSGLTGWPIDADDSDASWVQLRADAGATLCFQTVADYRAPEWPGQEHPQQAHCDFAVDDLDVAEAGVLALGARKHDEQPQPSSWRVYLDPAGHPFCLITS